MDSPSDPTAAPSERAEIRLTAAAWEALFRAQVAVMRKLQADPAFRQVSLNEYDVLFNLSRCPTGWLRLNELNQVVLLSQPSMSRLVERLEKQGLVRRRLAPEDRRGILIGLTDEGRELQKTIGREHVKEIHRLLAPALAPDELEQLMALTDKLRRGIPD